YRPIKFYEEQLASNRAKKVLVNTATSTHQTRVISPQLRFNAPNDNVLRQEITEAQKPAAVYDYRLHQMELMLQEGEKDREKLTTPRWRASFDLAMGRVCALRARAYGYNIVLAEMKSTPKSFQTKGSNAWRLVPSKEIAGGPQVRKVAKKAQEYLTRVIDEHQGTPWAMLAERELGTPLGWEWQEYRDASAAAKNGNGNNNPNLLQLAEEEKKKQMQKKMAEKKRVKPNL
ncbi:MAG: VWA domain-containing protein, partial [Planctomycetaceae bacterium]|nr:VWA domain-containing protein [Planctomycetaceae bacterium]